MTPALLMRRIIAPQAVRTMIPAFGNQTVGALKNSSLASVISVQELTLRSTQLASSTFDFFSIFFASGLIYLGLTAAVGVIQLMVERALDLDRASGQGRLAVFLPWRRVDRSSSAKPAAPIAAASGQIQVAELPPPRAATRRDRAAHAAMVQRNNIAVEGRRGGGAVGSERIRQEHAVALYQPPGRLGWWLGQGRRPPPWAERGWPAAVAARHRQ
jgi:polar amino acid transport system permease protein